MKIFTILSAVVFLAGCSSGEIVKRETYRYLQTKNPINGEIMVQVDLVTEDACRLFLEVGKADKNPLAQEAAKMSFCNHISVSASLPYRKTVKELLGNTIIIAEFATLQLCERGNNAPNVEIVNPCHRK